MRMYNWTFDQTIKYVSDRRDIACPNPGFTEQLREFENKGFLFEGEDIFINSKNQDSYLHIVSEMYEEPNVICEDENESSSSSQSLEDEYFEEGSL